MKEGVCNGCGYNVSMCCYWRVYLGLGEEGGKERGGVEGYSHTYPSHRSFIK